MPSPASFATAESAVRNAEYIAVTALHEVMAGGFHY